MFSRGGGLVFHETSGKLYVLHNTSSTYSSYRGLFVYTPGTTCADGTVTTAATSALVYSGTTTLAEPLSLAVKPDDENTIYVGLYKSGLWRSTDGGTNWTQLASGRTIKSIVLHPNDAKVLIAGGDATYSDDYSATYYAIDTDITAAGGSYYRPGVIISTDEGTSFMDVSAAFAAYGMNVTTLDIRSSHPYELVIGTSGQGALRLNLENIVDWSETVL